MYLLTRDKLIVMEGKYEPFTDRFNMNTSQQAESIQKIPDASHFKYILTGHNGIIKTEM